MTHLRLRSLIREALLLELRNAPDSPVPSDGKYYARPIRGGYVLYYAVGPNNSPQAIPGTLGYYFDATYVQGSKPVHGYDYKLTPEQIAKAEELVTLGLYSKSKRKIDHPDISFDYRSKDPQTTSYSWKSPADVPKTYTDYGLALNGFEYLLVDTENRLVSLDSSWKENQTRRGGGRPGEASRDKSYVMPSGDVAFTSSGLELQKLLKHLVQVDPRVTPEYKIVSPDDKYEGQTIGQVSDAPRTTDVALGNAPSKLFAYHGTSTKRWPEIEKKGMHPGKFEVAYVDQIPGYSDKNLYFTLDPHTAENYATRAAVWDKAAALILKVEIPDITRIIPDEDAMGTFILSREYTLTQTERTTTTWDWTLADPQVKGTKPGDKITIAGEQHPRSIMKMLRMANQTRSGYGKTVEEEPSAGPEYVDDAEYRALINEIQQKMASFLTRSLGGETFAYRGWIPPKFVKKWKEYPRKPYPRAVDAGGGTGREYEETRQAVLKKVKRFNESLIRKLVRSMLAEAVAPNFASSVTHSAGWISPEGEYFYDPQKRDHGEWAAFQVEKDPKLMATFLEVLKQETGPIPPPPPRTPAEQAVYDAKSEMGKRMDDWRRQGGRKLEGKTIPPYNNMSELYYSDIQSEVRSSALRALLMNGWGKVSNAYGIELWKPSRSVIETWMNLGMESGSDPEMYHNIYNKQGSLAEGDWGQIERFMRRLS
jgi:hypothetical protein